MCSWFRAHLGAFVDGGLLATGDIRDEPGVHTTTIGEYSPRISDEEESDGERDRMVGKLRTLGACQNLSDLQNKPTKGS